MLDHEDSRPGANLFVEETRAAIKLSGYKKQHRLPTKIGDSESEFLIGLSKDEVSSILDERFAKLKSDFGFRRAQIQVSEVGPGIWQIKTPNFVFELLVSQHFKFVDQVQMRCGYSQFSDWNLMIDPKFDSHAGRKDWRLEIPLANSINIVDTIDQLELNPTNDFELRYAREPEFVEIAFDGFLLRVEAHRYEFSGRKTCFPSESLLQFREAIALLASEFPTNESPFTLDSMFS